MTPKKALTALAALVALIPGLLAGTAASASTTGVQPGDPDWHSTVCYRFHGASGGPIAGARITVSDHPDYYSMVTKGYITGSDGCVHLPFLEDSRTGGKLSTSYFVSQSSMVSPDGRYVSEWTEFVVQPGETKTMEVSAPRAAGRLVHFSGRVTFEGKPVTGARVYSSAPAREYYTDENGYYEGYGYPGSKIEVKYTINNSPAAGAESTLPGGGGTVNLDMTRLNSRSVELIIQDSTKTPIEGATISIPFRFAEDGRARLVLGETDENGSIGQFTTPDTYVRHKQLVALPDGCVGRNGEMSMIVSNYYPSYGNPVQVLDVACDQSTFAGTVTSETGPVADATVEVLANGAVVTSATTGVDGTYKVSARRLDAPGAYTLRISAEGMVTQERAVPADTDQAGVDFHLLPPDTVAPVVNAEPGHLNLLAGLEWDALLGVSALDETDGAVLPALVGETPTTVGDHALTYEARDGAGNVGTAGRTVTVAEPSLSITEITAPHTATSGDEVAWSFVVLNDSIFPVVLDNAKCDTSALAPGESTSCTGSGTADAGR